jgi:hypothetical protein
MHENGALKSERCGQRRYWASRRIGPSGVSQTRDGRSEARERPVITCCGARGMAKRRENMVLSLAWHRHPRARHPVTGRCQSPAA